MATSGSYNFSVTRSVLVTDALIDAGVVAVGNTPEPDVMSHAVRKLQMLIKLYTIKGLKLWKQKEFTLFLTDGENSYSIGPTGDECTLTSEIVKTEIRVAAVATDTIIQVDSTTGMVLGDRIGIELDDGTMHWTTISSVTDGDTLVLTAAIPTGDAAAVDNDVWTYTNKIQRPLEIYNLFIRDRSDNDTTIGNPIAMSDYYGMGTNTSEGQVCDVWFDPSLNNATIRVRPLSSDSYTRLMGIARIPIEDMDATSDDFDFPQEWYLPLQLNLAVHLTPAAATETSEFKKLAILAKEALDTVEEWDREQNTSVRIMPDLRGYR